MDRQPTHNDSATASGGARATVVLWSHRVARVVVLLLVGFGIHHLFIEEYARRGSITWLFLALWVVGIYLLLPRMNRLLTRIYVPDYFIGRTRTSDGLLGDPVNLAVCGTTDQVTKAMTQAGWTQADPLTLRTGWHIVWASVLGHSYPAAPVSPLFLFGEKQALVFERELAGSPAQRHHVRFWICPPQWRLPGGAKVDLLGAATFDRRVGLSLFTLRITHKIAERTDQERDRVVAAFESAGATVTVIEHFTTGYHARNGGGDAIETDGDLPIIDVRHC